MVHGVGAVRLLISRFAPSLVKTHRLRVTMFVSVLHFYSRKPLSVQSEKRDRVLRRKPRRPAGPTPLGSAPSRFLSGPGKPRLARACGGLRARCREAQPCRRGEAGSAAGIPRGGKGRGGPVETANDTRLLRRRFRARPGPEEPLPSCPPGVTRTPARRPALPSAPHAAGAGLSPPSRPVPRVSKIVPPVAIMSSLPGRRGPFRPAVPGGHRRAVPWRGKARVLLPRVGRPCAISTWGTCGWSGASRRTP